MRGCDLPHSAALSSLSVFPPCEFTQPLDLMDACHGIQARHVHLRQKCLFFGLIQKSPKWRSWTDDNYTGLAYSVMEEQQCHNLKHSCHKHSVMS